MNNKGKEQRKLKHPNRPNAISRKKSKYACICCRNDLYKTRDTLRHQQDLKELEK